MKSLNWCLLSLIISMAVFIGGPVWGEEKPAGDLKVAVLHASSLSNPYNAIIQKGLQQAAQELGATFAYTENVTPDRHERILREYADNGYKVIVSSMTGHQATTRRVAKDYPEIAFLGSAYTKPVPPNFSVFVDWIHESAYLCGMIAGKLTKTNIIGTVGGFATPDVSRAMNAFKEGAKEVNPDVKFKVTFIGAWFNPPKVKEATIGLIEAGADMIYAERYGSVEACQEKGVMAFGALIDKSTLGPETVIASATWDFYPTARHVIESMKNGTYQAEDLMKYSLLSGGGSKLVINPQVWDKLPVDLKESVKMREQEIIEGKFQVPSDKNIPKSD